MSRMSNLWLEISTMLDQGFSPATISQDLEVPVSWVYEIERIESENENSEDITDALSPFQTINS